MDERSGGVGPLLLTVAVIVLGCGSCRKTEIATTKHGMVMRFDSVGIDQVREISWAVGHRSVRRQKVSKGFVVVMGLPKLGKRQLLTLDKKGGVDSWIVRVERDTIHRDGEFIGHFMVPFEVQTRGERTSSVSEARFRIYYAAASISPRLQRFSCPAFDHGLRIDDFVIQSEGEGQKSLIIRRHGTVGGHVETAGFVPLDFNGGMSLKGTYMISTALYSSRTKALMSRYVPLGNSFSVVNERPVFVKGCGGGMRSEQRNKPRIRLEDIKLR